MERENGEPQAVLTAVTEEARAALGGRADIHMLKFPFKVGRESRQKLLDAIKSEIERRLAGAPPLNDLYLLEPLSDSMQISREHFSIEYRDGQYVLVDRGSRCGTVVAEKVVGANSWWVFADLKDGDLIIVGTADSPYVFRFEIARTEPSLEG
jgi:hypothetical protein